MPESLDLGFSEVFVFLPKDRFGAGEDVQEAVEVGFRHF